MAEAIAPYNTARDHALAFSGQGSGQGYSTALARLALVLVWLAMAISSAVFIEPAPVDAVLLALIWILPVAFHLRFSKQMMLIFMLWLVVSACGLVATVHSTRFDLAIPHTLITLYLALMSLVFAAFIAYAPRKHISLIMSGYMAAALIAVGAGFIGYFQLVPGLDTLFTEFQRARGTFKDPNVYGAFLVLPILYSLHVWRMARPGKAMIMLALMAFLCLGILISFSRGAWLNLACGLAVYGYLSFIFAANATQRLKLVLLGFAGLCVVSLAFVAALQNDKISGLLAERAALSQSYDEGPEGRFGGQKKAMQVILDYPLGVGAREFGVSFHHEDPHNVYLSMFLNAGWLGGLLYLAIIIFTLTAGFRFVLKNHPNRDIFIVFFAGFIGMLVEGFVVDTDHWRSFFLLLAALWGLMSPQAHKQA